MACPEDFENVEALVDKVLTEYRESPKLLHLIRTYLRQVEIAQQATCDLPAYFDLNNAVGDQLTLLGRRMGFPRSHCVCDVQPVFGFECSDGSGILVDGFCADVKWQECADLGISTISIDDDNLYRKFLSVRRYQMTRKFTRASLEKCLEIFWGDTAAILDARNGRVVIAPGRILDPAETAVTQLYPRVLPVPVGIDIRFHFGTTTVFGFGDGWGGWCDGVGAGVEITTEDDETIYTEGNQPIESDNLGIGTDWMCAVNVRAYDC